MSSARPVLARDGVTLTGYLILGTWGWFLYGWGAMLPQLGRDQGISRTLTGLHSVALAGGSVVAGLGTVALVRALHRRGVLQLGAALVITGLGLLVAGGDLTAVTLPAVLIAGTGGALIVNTANSVLADHHGEYGATALSEGNAMASCTGLAAPLAVGAGVAAGLTWRPAIALTVPLLLAALLVLQRQPRGVAALDRQLPARSSSGAGPLPAAFWPAAATVVTCVGVEFCLAGWSAELLRDQVGFSPGAAAAGVSAVIGGMAVGRVVVGRLALRRAAAPLLLGAIALCATGWLVMWLATTGWLALLGLFVTGCGMAAHYPLGAAIAYRSAPGQNDQAAGVISTGIGVAAGGGPFALGALADATSTHTAFLVVPVLLGIAMLLLLRIVSA